MVDAWLLTSGYMTLLSKDLQFKEDPNRQSYTYANIQGCQTEGKRGLSIQVPRVSRAHRDTRINGSGCGEGPREIAYV